MEFVYNDGGRQAAGFKGSAGDCVCRAIAIATGRPYAEVYNALANGMGNERKGKSAKAGKRSARNGIHTSRKWFKSYMASLGFTWVATMGIGTGCRVHLHDGELPPGRLVVAVSKHYTTVIDGVVHDTFNPQRDAHNIRVLKDGETLKIGEWELTGEGGIITVVNGVRIRPRQAASIQRRCVYGYWKLQS